MSARSVILLLGSAGLIPFVVPALLVITASGYSDIAIRITDTYAFAIICFLTGSWWGVSSGPGKRPGIILSNAFLVLTFLLFLLAPSWWSLAAAILLPFIFVLERGMSLFPVLPNYYQHMRAILTIIASGSLFVVHFAR